MSRLIISFLIIGSIFIGINAFGDNSKQENPALSAADKWLALIDNEKYSDSWEKSAELLKNAIKPLQWEQSLIAARKPLGKLVSRKVKMKVYKTSLPGAPDGEYVVIQYDTKFENKKMAIETVTPMLDKDGIWRVSGYYIK